MFGGVARVGICAVGRYPPPPGWQTEGVIRVGLTGGIGAGKSTVARTFAERGGYLVDADKIAREVVEPDSDGLRQLVDAFGPEILGADGALDRPALAARAFADEQSRTLLNSITHPLIGARTQQLIDEAPTDAVVVQDIPLLVESKMAPFFHLVVIVGADEALRLERLTTLRGLDADDARARIAAQADDAQRRAVADVWLDNSGTPEQLAVAAGRIWDERLRPLEANIRAGRPATVDPHWAAAEPDREALPGRLTNRLWAIAGDKATAVAAAGEAGVPELRITVRDAAAAEDLGPLLTAGGFPPDGSGRYASADPGRPATVVVALAD